MPRTGRRSYRNGDRPGSTVDDALMDYFRTTQRVLGNIADTIGNTERELARTLRPRQTSTPFDLVSTAAFTVSAPTVIEAPAADTGLAFDRLDDCIRWVLYGTIPSNERIYAACPISFADFTDDTIVAQVTECRHYFHAASLMRHLRSRTTCPYCRHNMAHAVPVVPIVPPVGGRAAVHPPVNTNQFAPFTFGFQPWLTTDVNSTNGDYANVTASTHGLPSASVDVSIGQTASSSVASTPGGLLASPPDALTRVSGVQGGAAEPRGELRLPDSALS
jgi:hypothetical protein